MASDNLFAIIGMLRAEMPDVPDEVFDRLRAMLSANYGGERPYVPTQPKRSRLEDLAAAGDECDSQRLAGILGVSVRHAQRLKRLR